MTQYTKDVENVRIKREAEIWALGVCQIHAHSLDSMAYDTRPQDTANGKSVVDTEYNSGIIQRTQEGKLIHTFGKKLTGAALVDAYARK
tara:strand:- start:225 stop:491 length:267 start_codon:yes stop_codon:yes gene_type:complete